MIVRGLVVTRAVERQCGGRGVGWRGHGRCFRVSMRAVATFHGAAARGAGMVPRPVNPVSRARSPRVDPRVDLPGLVPWEETPGFCKVAAGLFPLSHTRSAVSGVPLRRPVPCEVTEPDHPAP